MEPLESFSCAENCRNFRTRCADAQSAWPSGLVQSSYWRILADGIELTVYDTPVTHNGPQSFVVIPFSALEIKAISFSPLWNAEILPESLHINPLLENNTIIFSVPEVNHVLIETNGGTMHPLAIFRADDPSKAPDPEDESVLFFEPGIHHIRTLELKSGQTLYLSPGAIIVPKQPDKLDAILEERDWAGKTNYQDFIFSNGQKNIHVFGAGIVDLTSLNWHARRSMVFTSCENISISDVIFIGAAHWTLPFFGCKNIYVDKVRMIAYRENSDGIDLVDTQYAVVKNCFLRTGDDAVSLKSMACTSQLETHDILVQRCIVWNDKVRAFGVSGESRSNIYNAVFEDCDVVQSMADWTVEVGALAIYICDAAEVHHITFRDIRIRQESNYAICCMITLDKWSKDRKAGQIHDITFDRISMPENYLIYLSGYSKINCIKKIYFDNIFTLPDLVRQTRSNIYRHLDQATYVKLHEINGEVI